MNVAALQREFATLQHDPTLADEANLAGRERALDLLRFIGEVAQARRKEHTEDPTLVALHQQALTLQAQLTAYNTRLFTQLRQQIQGGAFTRAQLRQEFNRFTSYRPENHAQAHIGYDGLDGLLSGICEFTAPPPASQPLTTEMVHYEPTPASVILALVDQLPWPPSTVFYDLGSGLGQVTMLVHILTGVKAKGVEFEPAFCTYAQQCADHLGLTNVEFIHADACTVDYTDGDVFYLFTPFKGALLQAVLTRLAQAAQKRVIKICTYGPCTPHVARQAWLRSVDDNADHEFKLAIFTNC